MPANNSPKKKSSVKAQTSGKKNNSRAVASARSPKSVEKVRGGDPSRLVHQLMPYILGLVAIFIVVSYFIADSTGFVGGFLRNMFFGLFSHAAWAVPFMLASIAWFWKRDVASGSVGYKIAFSSACCTFISALIHAFSRNGGAEGVGTFNPVELFRLGLDGHGGGAVGGLVGNALWYALGFAGTLIFSIALILLFGIFLFGMTPHMFMVYIVTGIREWRAGLSMRMSDARAEREQMVADYETERAAKLAAREAARAEAQRAAEAKAAQRAKLKNRKAVTEFMGCDEDETDNFYDAASEFEQDHANDAIDPEVFNEIRAREAECCARVADQEPPFDVDDDEVESYAPPFDADKSRRERVKPMPPTGEQELSKLENDEIDLAKIFVEPSDITNTIPVPQAVDGEEIVTSAEIDLMVEKSRLSREEITPVIDDDDEASDEGDEGDVYAEVSHGRVRMEPMKVPEYTFPPLALLKYDTSGVSADMSSEIQQTATKLVETLRSFNVKTKIINVSRGPTITRYELQPEVGTKVRSIVNLVDDIALHLATSGVRIEAPIPGKEAVGIEVPNRNTSTVYIRELLEQAAFKTAQSRVTTTLGMDVAGAPVFLDIAKMPHLLIAGTTGSGKSVCINSLIISMLYKARPDEVKFIMIDPKKVELNVYNGIPHLLVPVVSDPKKAAGALHWAVTEMERRYELIEGAGVRNLKGYNQSIANDPDAEKLPQIVIIIDELADLMMMARDDVEEAICRIAQKARAAGMHLVIGTQRPSVDVVTGLIKANVPSRIAFTTANQVDSRTIIDAVGAEKLIGRGDMLYAPIGSVKPMRVQGCFVSDDEVEEVAAFIKNNYGAREYDQSVMDTIEREAQLCGNKKATVMGDGDEEANDGDPMLKPAIQLAVEAGKISTSLIQRRLQLGYGRAAKLIDTMEQMGIVSPPQGQKPRDVLISKQEYMEMELRRGE